ncbi:MAG: zinc ribbon domain-containing protein [Ruminococcus sp.]|nr:zinc ribbon domain-containing protein [Ruminococcus sp.]
MGFKDAVMGFAGKLGSSIDKGISSGKDGYNKMSDRGRIKRETDQLTSEINNIMLYVGKTLYADDPGNEKFEQAFSDIKAREEKLAALQKELEELDKQPAPAPQQPYVQPGQSVQPQPYVQPGQPVQPQPYVQPGQPVQPQPYVQPGQPVQPQPYAQPVQPVPVPPSAPQPTVPATVICKACGAELPARALFCDKCGAKQ